MTPLRIPCLPADAAALALYATLVTPPANYGDRAFFSERLAARPADAAPVLHVNKVRPAKLPLDLVQVERHPHADQVFLPLDVSRYLAVVMPSDAAGDPRPEHALAFLVPGNRGIIYHANVWHAGAAVLDRPGNFAVLMWRRGDDGDDEFRAIPHLIVEPPAAPRPLAHSLTETDR